MGTSKFAGQEQEFRRGYGRRRRKNYAKYGKLWDERKVYEPKCTPQKLKKGQGSSRQKLINDAIIQQRVEANRRAREAAGKLASDKANLAGIIEQRNAAKERVKQTAAAGSQRAP